MKATVIATYRAIGFHAWENAPAPVEYLKHPHRHVFTFRVEANIDHHDRDVEFHMLQAATAESVMRRYALAPGPDARALQFGGRSCEMLAHALLLDLADDWGVKAVEVWEDDENGARVEA